MYSKILVPIDGSENSFRALSHGLFLASKVDSKLTIVHVTEIPPFVYIQSQMIIDSIMNTLQEEEQKIIDEAKSIAKRYEIDYDFVSLKAQSIGPAITNYDDENNFDLIVIGSRGRGGMKSAILGSVSHYVFNHTKKPVLVIK